MRFGLKHKIALATLALTASAGFSVAALLGTYSEVKDGVVSWEQTADDLAAATLDDLATDIVTNDPWMRSIIDGSVDMRSVIAEELLTKTMSADFAPLYESPSATQCRAAGEPGWWTGLAERQAEACEKLAAARETAAARDALRIVWANATSACSGDRPIFPASLTGALPVTGPLARDVDVLVAERVDPLGDEVCPRPSPLAALRPGSTPPPLTVGEGQAQGQP